LKETLRKLVQEYNREKDRVFIEETFEALFKFYQDLNKEESRAMKENLTEETLAMFDLLKKSKLSKAEIKKIKKVSVELLETLKSERLNIANWRNKESTRDAVKQQIFDFLYDDTTGLPVGDYEESEVQSITDKVFLHISQAYPQLPSPIYGNLGMA